MLLTSHNWKKKIRATFLLPVSTQLYQGTSTRRGIHAKSIKCFSPLKLSRKIRILSYRLRFMQTARMDDTKLSSAKFTPVEVLKTLNRRGDSAGYKSAMPN
jgi:hypothetical protein